MNTSLSGTLVDIRTSCPEDYTFTWSSQPRVGKAPAGNLLLAAAIVFSGSTFPILLVYLTLAYSVNVCFIKYNRRVYSP